MDECDTDKTYIGQTSRELKTRIVEHRRAVRTGDENSGVYQHFSYTGHEQNLAGAKSLLSEPYDRSRRLLVILLFEKLR